MHRSTGSLVLRALAACVSLAACGGASSADRAARDADSPAAGPIDGPIAGPIGGPIAGPAAGTPAGTSATSPVAPAPGTLAPCASAGPAADALCWRAERRVDFAGDGRPFTIAIDARGPRADSLEVRVRVVRDDTTWYRADWNTVLYGAYDDRAHRPGADSLRTRATRQLARLLDDSAFATAARFQGGAADVERAMRDVVGFDVAEATVRARRGLGPADTPPRAAIEETYALIEPGRRARVDTARVRALVAELRDRPAWRFFRGGERTSAIAWSARERRFVMVANCC